MLWRNLPASFYPRRKRRLRSQRRPSVRQKWCTMGYRSARQIANLLGLGVSRSVASVLRVRSEASRGSRVIRLGSKLLQVGV